MTGTLSIGSTAAAFAQRRDALVQIRARLEAANGELSSGRRGDVHRALGARALEAHGLRGEAALAGAQSEGNAVLAVRLDAAAGALTGAADAVGTFLALAVPNRNGPGPTVAALQEAARSAYDALAGRMNASFGGARLFSGVDTDRAPLVAWDQAAAATGLSPRAVLEGIVGGGLADGADAAAKAAEVAASFAGANAAAPDRNFERSFYAGTPALDASGQPSERLRARIDGSAALPYGVQANDPAFRSALQGLAMIAAVDPGTMDADAYAAWVGAGIDAAARGADGIREAQARLGGQQAVLAETIERQKVRGDLLAAQTARLEGVDPYEAASRVSMLSTQLEASFASTARLMRLSFLSYM